MDFYVTIGDIKDTIHTYWNDHHTSSKFPEILHILYENKKYLDYEPVLPDIGALARLDDDSFLSEIRKLYFRFPYTILSYYYISETNVSYINRKLHRPFLFFILKLFVMGSCIFGAVKTADLAWAVGDIGVGLMAWLNIIAILLLNKKAFLCLRDYEKQLAIGLDPVFHPEKLGIKNANYWVGERAEEIRDKERAKLNSGSRQDLEGNVLNVASGN